MNESLRPFSQFQCQLSRSLNYGESAEDLKAVREARSGERGPAEKCRACTLCCTVWTLIFFSLLTDSAGSGLLSWSSWKEKKKIDEIADELAGPVGIRATQRPRVWIEALLPIKTPSCSGWTTVQWIRSVFGHLNWLLSVSRAVGPVHHSQRRGADLTVILDTFLRSEFEDLRARCGCLIC